MAPFNPPMPSRKILEPPKKSPPGCDIPNSNYGGKSGKPFLTGPESKVQNPLPVSENLFYTFPMGSSKVNELKKGVK